MTHHIAFLDTGIMGAPMAANLIKAGFTAAVWNRTRRSDIDHLRRRQ